MELATPENRAYYYECSNGRFRLNYYLSFELLEDLVKEGKVDKKVLKDFPDGYDLDCTEADFNDFERCYKYTHPFSAELLRHTFKAVFSSTNRWEKFKGSGWVPADFLESQMDYVEDKTKDFYIPESEMQSDDPVATKESFIRHKSKSVKRAKSLDSVLKEIEIESIDDKMDLEENFSHQIAMKKDTASPEEFFRIMSKIQSS